MIHQILPIILIAIALFATACSPAVPASTESNSEPAIAVESEATEAPTEESDTEESDTEESASNEAVAEESSAEEATTAPEEEGADGEASAAEVAMTKLDLNSVSGDDLLATIPDFGNRMVREFQEYRPYVSIQQFRREIGKYVDETQVALYEEYVYVPIQVNDSDAETLMQIPDLDETAAETLMAARPFDSNDAFLQQLVEVAPADDGTLAQAYLEAE